MGPDGAPDPIKPDQKKVEDFLKETGLPSDSDTWAKLSHTLDSPWTQFARRFIDRTLFAVPRYIHDNLVVPNQKDYPYYHRQYRRVPTVDQCYTHDTICEYEADMQFLRDRKVETQIITILGNRWQDCIMDNMQPFPDKATFHDPDNPCLPLRDEYNRAQLNFYIKYGDMGASAKSRSALMKQKHRMIWERRNGENTVAGQAKRAAEEAAAALA